MDYMREVRDGVTWLTVQGNLYMDAAGAPDLFTGSGWAYSTIQDNGYARDVAGYQRHAQLTDDSIRQMAVAGFLIGLRPSMYFRTSMNSAHSAVATPDMNASFRRFSCHQVFTTPGHPSVHQVDTLVPVTA